MTKSTKLPITMNIKSKFQIYKNGEKHDDITMNANYNGHKLKIKVNDILKKKNTQLQLSNDELFNLLNHTKTSKSLIQQLESDIRQYTQKKRNTRRKIKKVRKGKKQTRRNKNSIGSKKTAKGKTRTN